LEQAVKQYIVNDLSGDELPLSVQAIRDASLNQDFCVPTDSDQVAGEDSY
jgi:hypothetical protein